MLEKPFVYIVEDDAAIAGELARALEREGFRTAAAERFDRVVPDILAAAPDLVLLDLTLPGTDGQFIARDLREHSQVPIIVLTSRTTEIDEVMAMNLGADDFIPKPYRLRVLVARIQALLRRADGGAATILSHNGLELDSARSVARANEREVELTKMSAASWPCSCPAPGRWFRGPISCATCGNPRRSSTTTPLR